MPSTRAEWAGLASRGLFPFKAYVAVVVPFHFLFRLLCPELSGPTGATDGTGFMLLNLFMACAPILVVGALAQFLLSERRAALRALMFALPAALVFLVILARIHG
jgi:uncharacterized membrane protein